MLFAARSLLVSLFAVASCATADAPVAHDAHLAALENGMPAIAVTGEPPLHLTFTEWMAALDIPGASIAVVDEYRIVWTHGFGVVDADTRARVTPQTLFQAGSIAKPIAAMAALRMVEQGALSLDGDINQSLTAWRLADTEYTIQEHVTLRRLLSHTSGVTPAGFAGYEPGAVLPSLPQILDGAPPANSPAAVVMQTPGAAMVYSGPAYTIAQLAMTERANRPFPDLMRDMVLAPLGMTSSTYEQPLSAIVARRAASGHTSGGAVLSGRWRVHPEMAAAGLWSTPSDLARAAIEMARAKNGESHRVLSQAMAQRMLTEERESSALGWMLGADGVFWHNGATQGYRATMRMLAATGDGLVLMVNSDNGQDLFFPVANAVAADRAWPNYSPRQPAPAVSMRLIASRYGVARALSEYRGMRANLAPRLFGPGDLNGWGYALLERGRIDEAVQVFTDNVGYYPDNAYAYDSLGEGLLAAGRTQEAIAQYRRSLELDPANDNATAILARIEASAR